MTLGLCNVSSSVSKTRAEIAWRSWSQRLTTSPLRIQKRATRVPRVIEAIAGEVLRMSRFRPPRIEAGFAIITPHDADAALPASVSAQFNEPSVYLPLFEFPSVLASAA